MNWKKALTTIQPGDRVKYIGSPPGIDDMPVFIGRCGTVVRAEEFTTLNEAFPGFIVDFDTGGRKSMAEVELEKVLS